MSVTVQEVLVKFVGDASGLQRAAAMAGTAIKAFISIDIGRRIAEYGLNTMAWADDLGELATTIGMTTDRLQALQYAATANDGSIQSLNTALVKMTQVIGDAYVQGGPLAERMQELGIRALDMNGQLLSTSDILPMVADAIKNATSAQEKLSIATDFFGRSAAPSMVRVLAEGSAGLAELEANAKTAGAVMREELVAAAADANDKFETMSLILSIRMKTAFVGAVSYVVDLKNEIAGIADVLQKLANVQPAAFSTVDQSLIRETEEFKNMSRRFWQSRNAAKDEGAVGDTSAPTSVRPKITGGFIPYTPEAASTARTAVESVTKSVQEGAEKSGVAIGAVNKGVHQQIGYMKDLKYQVSDTFKSFTRSIASGQDALSALRNTALNVIGDIADSMLNMAFGGTSGGGIGGSIASALFGALGGIGGTAPKMKSFAVGTSYVPRDMLANIHQGEMIVPKHQADAVRSGQGGGGVVQNLNFSLGVQQTVRAEVMRMLPQIKQVAVGGVTDTNRRSLQGAF